MILYIKSIPKSTSNSHSYNIFLNFNVRENETYDYSIIITKDESICDEYRIDLSETTKEAMFDYNNQDSSRILVDFVDDIVDQIANRSYTCRE